MQLLRWTIAGIALALIGGCDEASHRQIPTTTAIPQLDGTWEIISVHRDGEADPVQVGALLTFANGEVRFQPKIRQNNFNYIS
jgi:hypothetical protein